MTYNELVTNIRNYTEVDSNVFSDSVINTFITLAENKILQGGVFGQHDQWQQVSDSSHGHSDASLYDDYGRGRADFLGLPGHFFYEGVLA